MQQEIEAKFLNVNHDDIRAKLLALDGVCQHPMRLMRRQVFDFADMRLGQMQPRKRLRLRDEGDKVTFTFKQPAENSEYSYEAETNVSSYDETKRILEGIGLQAYSYQESKRETWSLGTVEVVLDEWPWLNPYIEIEGPSEVEIQQAAVHLGFNWDDAKFGSIDTAYRLQYPILGADGTIGAVSEVKFDAPLPSILQGNQS